MVPLPYDIWRIVMEYCDCFTLVDIEQGWMVPIMVLPEEMRYAAHDVLGERLRLPKMLGGEKYWCWRFCSICVARNERIRRKVGMDNNKRKRE